MEYPDYDFNIYKVFEEEIINVPYILQQVFLYKIKFNTELVYSLKTFYKKYNKFNYFLFRKLNYDKLINFTEVETIIYWYENYFKCNKEYSISSKDLDLVKNKKNIIIHMYQYNDKCGGIVATYYLASLLDKLGERVRITSYTEKKNPLFNNIYLNDFEINDCIFIYSEGINSNPLNGKNIIRWILAPLNSLVSESIINTWNKNDLIYYFNNESRFENDKIGTIYKTLTCLYINPNITNYNDINRHGTCFTIRKIIFYNSIINIHNDTDYEIKRWHSQEDYISIFNKHKYFILYDPLCFLMTISIMCGCITIVYPIDGISKLEWLHNTFYSSYLTDRNLENIYGIAYGMDDIEYAENTIHLAYEQTKDMEKYFMKTINSFVDDMQNFEKLQNTLENNYNLKKY